MGGNHSAAPVSDASDDHHYRAPRESDLRGPCPGLNTLANHGYLPRDGRNITRKQLSAAIHERFGLSPLLAFLMAKKAISQGKGGLLQLSDLTIHNNRFLEHDVSLTRLDAALCDGHQNLFNPERFEKLLTFSKDGVYLTYDDVTRARQYFLEESKRLNTSLVFDFKQQRGAAGEEVLAMDVLSGRDDGRISIEFLRAFFAEEKFPDGWQARDGFALSVWKLYSGIFARIWALKSLMKRSQQ